MVKRTEELRQEPTPSYLLYQNALDYQCRMGLRVKIPECVDFYEGRQWPPATENTKNLPRPVVNVVKMICRSKKGAILSTPVKIHYKSYSPHTDIERFNSFAASVFREIGQDELDRLAIDDGIKKGSYFFHYFWDKESISQESGEVGALSCELIDPLNIFFANPAESNEQKQDWIMISSRIEVEKIKLMAEENADLTMLMPDGDSSDGKATLLTRYFRVGGEIFCERQTKFCIISKPFNIIPDSQSMVSGSDLGAFKRRGRILYPIVCGQYERREHSIYGMGEVEGLIPNQKSINFNIAMSLLNAQQCAWGKYVALPNALNGQKISNIPGQVLIDFSGTGEGIKRLPEAELSRAPMEITTALEELTRSVSGAGGVMTGEISGTSLSGAAIAYLQSQAQVPIEELKSSFWAVKRKQGLVVAQFLKHFYLKHAFIKADNKGVCCFDEFSSRDFESSLFEVYVEAIGGTKASLASDISLLDSCLNAGKISLETYIRAYPESAITNKEEILKQIELEKSGEVEILRRELSELKKRYGEK